eukprot:3317572-Rhodomonas_salina.1
MAALERERGRAGERERKRAVERTRSRWAASSRQEDRRSTQIKPLSVAPSRNKLMQVDVNSEISSFVYQPRHASGIKQQANKLMV